MTATESPANPSPRPRRRRRWLWCLLAPPAALGLAIWWFTEPLTDHPTPLPDHPADSDATPPPKAAVETLPRWPDGELKGDEAKTLILASTLLTTAQLSRVEGYTATLRKQERLSGKLGPENTLAMKVRNRPFAIYLKFLAPKAGKEVVYAEGHHDNKLIAHNGDWTRKLVPRLAVAPDSALALADSRHPVTEAGLVHLANRLLTYRKMDIGDDDAGTTLDRTTDPEGRTWLRSVHTHSVEDGTRPFARVEVLYDPITQFPMRIANYGRTSPGGEIELMERYAYDDLKLNAPLTPLDFDPANPAYEFMRF